MRGVRFMYGYYDPGAFYAKTYDKASWKPKKFKNTVETFAQQVVNYSNALNQFSEDFNALNSSAAAGQWQSDADDIKRITGDVNSKLKETTKNLLNSLGTACDQVAASNAKLAGVVHDTKDNMSAALESLNSINVSK
jgi:ABC-type transporter Mla subunit MlaD